MIKTSKFGGTSLANATRIINAAKIIKSDKDRRYIVVSAPGNRNEDDIKITDLLYRCAMCNDVCGVAFDSVEERLSEIVKGLNIELDLAYEIDKIRDNIANGAETDYIVSRGEYLTAIIFAKYLDFEFVDAADIIKFKGDEFDYEHTKKLVSNRLKNVEYVVIPGFYGSKEDGSIKTFSRGGSDYTGGIIAGATPSSLYENWTDVSGFRATDPKIIKQARRIKYLSYNELYKLANMGANVLHPCSVLPLRERGIDLIIKNTFDPLAEGTVIGAGSEKRKEALAGISLKKDCNLISVVSGCSDCPSGGIKIDKKTYAHQSNNLKADGIIGIENIARFGRPNRQCGDILRHIMGALESMGGTAELILSDMDGIKITLTEALKDDDWRYFKSKFSMCEMQLSKVNLLTLVGYRESNLLGRAATVIEKVSPIIFVANSSSMDLTLAVPADCDIKTILEALYAEFFEN